MNRSNSRWATQTTKSLQQSTLIDSFISNLAIDPQTQKQDIDRQLYEIDKKLCQSHIQQRDNFNPLSEELSRSLTEYGTHYPESKEASTPMSVPPSPLAVPKEHSLTDALLRNTLGCDQKYAKEYLQILDQTTVTEDKEKQKRIQEVKDRFAKSNSYIDFCANSKPYNLYRKPVKASVINNSRPVVDNEHQGYLKTQLIFLQKPKGTKVTEKEYYDKHSGKIVQKIEELGGMEDTLARMEGSLNCNEIQSAKKRDILQDLAMSPRRNPFDTQNSPSRSRISRKNSSVSKNWVQRSKLMRQTFKSQFGIS